MGRPAVPWGSPASLIPTEVVLPGGPATKAQQWWVASGRSPRTRSTKAWAASASGACASVVTKRLRRTTSSTRWMRAGIRYRSGITSGNPLHRGREPPDPAGPPPPDSRGAPPGADYGYQERRKITQGRKP